MPDVPMTVSLFTPSKLQVNPPVGKALMNQQPTLRWSATGSLTIQYIGFNRPVGPGQQIEVPHKDPDNPADWIAKDLNQYKDLFTYSVFAMTGDGRVLSTDPQIENEGTSGGVDDMEPPNGGGGG